MSGRKNVSYTCHPGQARFDRKIIHVIPTENVFGRELIHVIPTEYKFERRDLIYKYRYYLIDSKIPRLRPVKRDFARDDIYRVHRIILDEI